MLSKSFILCLAALCAEVSSKAITSSSTKLGTPTSHSTEGFSSTLSTTSLSTNVSAASKSSSKTSSSTTKNSSTSTKSTVSSSSNCIPSTLTVNNCPSGATLISTVTSYITPSPQIIPTTEIITLTVTSTSTSVISADIVLTQTVTATDVSTEFITDGYTSTLIETSIDPSTYISTTTITYTTTNYAAGTSIISAAPQTSTVTSYVTLAQSCSATTVITLTATPVIDATSTISSSASPAAASSTSTSSASPTIDTNLCQSTTNVIQNGNFYDPGIGGNPFPPWVFTSTFSNVEPYVQIYETPDNSANSLLLVPHPQSTPGSFNFPWSFLQTVNVCPTEPYSFSFWAQVQSYGSDCAIDACFNGQCRPIALLTQDSTSWGYYNTTIAALGTDTVDVGIQTDPSQDCWTVIYFGDFEFSLA